MPSRYLECLALVLQEETSYPQRPRGPYVRKVRRDGGKIVASAFYDDEAGVLCWSDRSRSQLPSKPDGCAFDDDPHDTGGRTCMGILQREYDAFRRSRGLPCQDVWRIADREIEAIFEPQYWTPLRCGEMPAGVDYFMVDFGFACGIGKAAEKLQRVLGVKVDHHVGVNTLDALSRADPSEAITVLAAERESYYRQCRTFWKHGKGWLVRNKRVAARAQAMVSFQEPTATPQAPQIEPGTPVPSADSSRDSGAAQPGATKVDVATVTGGVGGGLLLLGQVNTATRETRDSGLGTVLWHMLSSWQFWAAAACCVALLVAYREDVKKRLGWG